MALIGLSVAADGCRGAATLVARIESPPTEKGRQETGGPG